MKNVKINTKIIGIIKKKIFLIKTYLNYKKPYFHLSWKPSYMLFYFEIQNERTQVVFELAPRLSQLNCAV